MCRQNTDERLTKMACTHREENILNPILKSVRAAGTFIKPEDISDRMMTFAWLSLQPTTELRVLRDKNRSWGLMALIWPMDMLLLSLPRAEIVVASMLSPKLPAKAAEIYRCKRKKTVSWSDICVLIFSLLWKREPVIPTTSLLSAPQQVHLSHRGNLLF